MSVFFVTVDSNNGFYSSDYITADTQTIAEDIMIARHIEDTAGGTDIRSKDVTEEYTMVMYEVEKLGTKVVVNLRYTSIILGVNHTSYSGLFNSIDGVYEFHFNTNKGISAINVTDEQRKQRATQGAPRKMKLMKK